MQRLFSTFPDGWPGTGLLLLRIALGTVLAYHVAPALFGAPPYEPTTLQWAAAGAGFFIVAGLWTPISGVLVGILELCIALSHRGDACNLLLVGALGIAIAMLGPGAWSIDARLCGRRRIEIPAREIPTRDDHTPSLGGRQRSTIWAASRDTK